SPDGGKTWQATSLGEDLGRYAFRGWQAAVTLSPGEHGLQVRATSNAGETQPTTQAWNPAGYLRNVIETTTVKAG
ncbi:MAG: oxidase, partial [Acetobacteraceae bacterium]|nr:oxidase [Acetobacteraceae bacterium]